MLSQSNENSSPPHRPVPMQLQPDLRYKIFAGADANGVLIADVFVVSYGNQVQVGSQMCIGGGGGTEHWFYSNSSSEIKEITAVSSIYVAAEALAYNSTYQEPIASYSYHTCAANTGKKWSSPQQYQITPPDQLQSYSFWSKLVSGTNWGLELVVKTAASDGSSSLFGIQWYRYDVTGQGYSGVVDEGYYFTGQWNKGQNWNGASPYSGADYRAQTSM